MTALRAGGLTDVGRVRTVNQDRVYFDERLFAIADGMGGHAGGEVAAATAIDVLRQEVARDASGAGLSEAVRTANQAVWERARAEEELRGMGTTVTAAAVVADSGTERLELVNVGDSRAYLFRGDTLDQLTEDHSVVEEMVRAGELSAGEAAVHPSRHMLTRVVGVEPSVEVDHWSLRPVTGDRYLLCSDGLFNEVGDAEITTVLARLRDPQATADELVQLARAHGGSDNITVIVIDVVDWTNDAPSAGRAGESASSGAPLGTATLGGAAAGLAADHAGPAGHPAAPPGTNTSAATPLDITTVVPVVTASGSSAEPSTAAPTVAPPPPPPAPLPPPPRSTSAGSAPVTPATARPGGPGEPSGEAPRRSRRVTIRVVLFLIVLAALIVGAVLTVQWFANRSYYVGLDHSQIVIYRGQPGGTLWFQPRVVQRTGFTTASVLPSRVPDLQHGTEEPSLDAARRYVANLAAEARSLPATSSPSTTAPAPTVAPGGPVFP